MGIDESRTDQYFDDHKNDALVGRIGTVADTSAAIVYLASESFVNGCSLVVDGGICCVGLPGVLMILTTDFYWTDIIFIHISEKFDWIKSKKTPKIQNRMLEWNLTEKYLPFRKLKSLTFTTWFR